MIAYRYTSSTMTVSASQARTIATGTATIGMAYGRLNQMRSKARIESVGAAYRRQITLTTHDVQALQALLIDMIDRYIDEPKRAQFVTELDARLAALADNQRRGMQ